jgi:hypothetical protein
MSAPAMAKATNRIDPFGVRPRLTATRRWSTGKLTTMRRSMSHSPARDVDVDRSAGEGDGQQDRGEGDTEERGVDACGWPQEERMDRRYTWFGPLVT